jgi:hypothetical protein
MANFELEHTGGFLGCSIKRPLQEVRGNRSRDTMVSVCDDITAPNAYIRASTQSLTNIKEKLPHNWVVKSVLVCSSEWVILMPRPHSSAINRASQVQCSENECARVEKSISREVT